MVIKCPHCQARFKLPQNKMKPGGTKVRCTKCKIIFMVTPPQGGALPKDSTSGAAVRDAGEENGSGFAEGFGDDFDNADFFSDGDEGDEFLLGETTFDDDDSDFFALDDAECEEQDDLSWSEDSAPSFLNVDPEPSGKSLPDEVLEGGEVPEKAEPGAQDESPEYSLTLAEEEAPEIGESVSGLPEEEFFFDGTSSRASLPAPRPPAERRKKSYTGLIWALLLLLIIAGGGYGYHARHQLSASLQALLIDWKLVPVPPAEGKGLKPGKLTGYFINNQREGRLFIIQGQVLNEGDEPRAAIVVKGSVYDAGGTRLAEQSAFCGNPMGKEQLRVWPMMRMTERMQNQFGEMLANLNLEPQRDIPFTLVFKDLPGEVAEFEVVVETSEPVIK
jgi:predicted Zn finger-like uncharacterized protein